MYYGAIKKNDIANGNGVRVSLFVSGCTHRCRNCFNPETWNFSYGQPFTKETEEEIFEAVAPSYVEGLTLLGGDPTEKENQRALLPFLRRFREKFPNKTVWCYSGYVYEDFLPGGRAAIPETAEYLSLIDILVDGPFIEKEKQLGLLFRGSRNQRIIDVKKTLQSGKIVLWDKLTEGR